MRTCTPRKGFTLIELLIVIAIILILISIALPNFLEAQLRAKATRVQGEFRTLSIAMEEYALDYKDYPQNWYDLYAHPEWSGKSRFYGLGMHYTRTCLPQITTPTAYLKNVDYDEPFPYVGMLNQGYFYAHTDYTVKSKGLYWHQPSLWCFASCGPDHLFHEDWKILPGYPSGNWVEYSPTNGTTSAGNLTKYGPFR